MKRVLPLGMVFLVLCAGCKEPRKAKRPERPERRQRGAPATRAAARPKAVGVRHVVLVKYKEGATAKEIGAIEEAFRSLQAEIPQIRDFEWGRDVDHGKRSGGLTHCFLLTFRSAAGRDAYLPHPAHREFAELLGGSVEEVLVLDYAPAKTPPLPNPHLGKLRHVVLFQFKDAAGPDQIRAVLDAGARMPGKIPQILAMEHGGDVSVEHLQQGFSHAILMTFPDAAARDAYLPHPVHQELVRKLTPILKKLLVVDYVAQR